MGKPRETPFFQLKLWSNINQLKGYNILRDRRTRLIILFILFSTIVPLVTYYCLLQEVKYDSNKNFTCVIDPSYRVPCGIQNFTCDVSCCLDTGSHQCYHSIPARFNFIEADGLIYKPTVALTPLITPSIEKLMLTVRDIDINKTQIILHDPNISYIPNEIEEKNYIIKKDANLLGVEVFRKTTSELLLTTFRGPLIASENYWEWTFQLTNGNLVGLGEIIFNENQTITKVIYKNENDHNTLPVFMAYSNGNFHGASVEHEGPLEVTVLPSKLIILRSLAGSRIIINLCVGGTNPQDVVNQLRTYKPAAIPYWVLGAHICRDGLTSIDSAIAEYTKFVETETNIHFVSDCIHENLYFMLDGSTEVNDNIKHLIKNLQKQSHFMLSLPPHVPEGILHDKAVELDILYLYNNNILNGNYLGQVVSYPDFTHKSVDAWIKELISNIPVEKVDGLVLRDNWPIEQNHQFINNKKFPYLTKDIASALNKTIPVNSYSRSETPPVQHILKHNQYGVDQAKAFKNNLNYDILMTSSFDYNAPEAALIQNINISWPNFKRAITTTLYHSLFGNSLISIPICGSTSYYNKELHEELCMRWYMLAATFPLFRISSELPRRDPSSLPSKFASNIAYESIKKRTLLLPYYHTVLHLDNILVKPMFYDFHNDKESWKLDEQYMLGNALLVAHPVLPQSSKLKIYLPPSAGIWYEFWGGMKYNATGWLNLDIVESDWVMFIHHGHIVPLRNNKQAKIGSNGPDDTFSFAVALNCTQSKKCKSDGVLMLSSVSLKLSADYEGLVVSNLLLAKEDIGCDLPKRSWPSIIESVIVFGINNDYAIYSNFLPVNMCENNQDEIYIEYALAP